MKHVFRAGIIALLWLGVLASAAADDSALYSGKCRNVTFGAEGLLKLFIIEKDDGIEGYMSISGWLVGSGPLKGTREGNKFRFRTTDPLWDMVIDWQGSLEGAILTGEYFCEPNAKLGTPRQVGEWEVSLKGRQKDDVPESEAAFRELFMLHTEADLNAPVKLPDGTSVTGAQGLFQSIHPVGKGLSVNVESVEIDWKPGSEKKRAEDIHRFRLDYVLYWKGVLRPTGWTRARLAYNTELESVTAHDILETTGTTRKDVEDIAFGIGFLLGKAAVESMLESK